MLSNFFKPNNSNILSLTGVRIKSDAIIDNLFRLESNPPVSIIIKFLSLIDLIYPFKESSDAIVATSNLYHFHILIDPL